MRRANHDKVIAPQLVACANCGEPSTPHRACPSCGHYKGRAVDAKTASVAAKKSE
jgi:large subunit ribosomal protein L32